MTRAHSRIEDHELVEAMARGDRQALAELYDRFGGIAYSLVLRMVRVHEAAQEVVQDAFLSAWRTAASYEPARASVATWLVTIARNRAIDELRRTAARPVAQDGADAALVPAPERDGPLENALASERGEQVRAVLAELPDAQRVVLELAYFGGRTQHEIAACLNVPVGTVKTRAHYGLQRLRELLVDAGVRDD